MKKKILLLLVLVIGIFGITACGKKEARKEAIDFKNEYEALNGKVARGDLVYRSLNISDKNPFIKTTDEDIANKLANNDTFYLYVGDPLCPWCRSGLEKFTNVAIDKKIKDIYYIDFWDDNHNEILRDLYEIELDKDSHIAKETKRGTDSYYKILDAVEDFVQEYTITKDNKTYGVGEKRIYGGDIFYFENGKCKKYVSLRSDKLANAFDELSEEVLKDQEDKFSEFFDKKAE